MADKKNKIYPKMILRDFTCVNCHMAVAEEFVLELTPSVLMVGLDVHLGNLRKHNKIACRKCKDIEEAINNIGLEAAKGEK